MTRFIFTATAGRSGQGYLASLLNHHVPDCIALFEEPQVKPALPGALGDLERYFRRRFVETHELLGRGRAMTAFQAGDEVALNHMAAKRIAWLTHRMDGATVCFDISKYFIRGLHRAMARAFPNLVLVRLVRDPVANMRSFLNRNKNFYLDNDGPGAPRNELRLDPERLDKAGLYLWAWCEVYLRADALAAEFSLSPVVEIHTEDLRDAAIMTQHLAAIGLSHTPLLEQRTTNDNPSQGFAETRIHPADIETFERFRDFLPPAMLDRIPYLKTYNPRTAHCSLPPERKST
jgi:hypothetical protein